MKWHWLSLLSVIVGMGVLTLTEASACSVRGYELFPPTMAIRRVHKVNSPNVKLISIRRGKYDENASMTCGDAGLLTFAVSKSPDIGYTFKVVSGNLDPYTFPKEIVRAPLDSPGEVVFPWLDWPRLPAEPIDAVVEVTAYDQWLNESKPIRIHIVESNNE